MHLRLTYVIIYGTLESKIKTFLILYINKTFLLLEVSWLEEERVYGKFKSSHDIQIPLRI